MKVTIYDIAFGGNGVGKLTDNKIVFVPQALPGEVITLKNVKDKKKYAQAEIDSIIKPSPDRIISECPYFGKCGGCQYHHVTYNKEIFYKEKQLKDILQRIGKLSESTQISVHKPENVLNYRNSVTFQLNRGICGFIGNDNKSVLKIEECKIINTSLNSYFRRNIKQIKALRKKRLMLKTDGSNISSVIDDKVLFRKVRSNIFKYNYKSFFQTNFEILNKIIDTLHKEITSGDSLFDLYCGVGVYSICLQDKFNHIIGIDENKSAIGFARENQADSEKIDFYHIKVEESFVDLFNSHHGKSNILVVNPPRTGLDKKIAEQIARLDNIDKILYVSCNPATLARDLNIINEYDYYSIRNVHLFDMFPRTKFFETLVILDSH